MLAAHPRYQSGLRVKIKSVYIDYLMSGTEGTRGCGSAALR
jgi:hypothetical protein